MILSALGHHHGWSRAELEALTDEDAKFWHSAAAELHERAQKEG